MQQSLNVIPYEKLPGGNIRLLLLQPAADRSKTLECHLLAAPINEAEYEALSYVWGQEDASHRILVDGQEALVRPNLYDALLELRLADGPRALWVDSICINQTDMDERNSQVRLMGEIYSSAKQVVVWLGRGDDEIGDALDFIQLMGRLDDSITQQLVEGKLLDQKGRRAVFEALGFVHGGYEERTVNGLKKLAANTWWKRIWTTQEIVLAKSAILQSGNKSATWANLSHLADFSQEVSHHNFLTDFGGRPMEEAVFDEMTMMALPLYIAATTVNMLSYKRSKGIDIGFEYLVQSQACVRQATDQRDMVFALVGLTNESEMIKIDYGLSKREVYTAAMRTMLARDDNWGIALQFVEEREQQRDPDLPSWVPDFGILHAKKATTLAATGVGSSLIIRPLYNASHGDDGKNGKPHVDPADDRVLRWEGVIIGKIDELGSECPRFPNDFGGRRDVLRAAFDDWKEVAIVKGEEYVGGGSVMEAFWRTVMLDLLLWDRDYFAGNPDRRDKRMPYNIRIKPPTTREGEDKLMEGILDAPVPKTVLEKLGNRRFFAMQEGYFGLGPAAMRKGDLVVLLRGNAFPTVVRPAEEGQYTMVGECYVQGLMDGQVIAAIEEGKLLWQILSFT